MASSSSRIVLVFFFLLGIICKSSCFLVPVVKDVLSPQYLTKIYPGNSDVPLKLVVDLGGQALWIDCEHVSSSSFRPVQSGSIKCLAAKGSPLFMNSKPPICGLGLKNSVSGLEAVGDIVEGLVSFSFSDDDSVDDFFISSAPTSLLQGLASGAKGIMGLGRSRISLPSQLSMAFETNQRFSLCLSSSEGFIAPGDSILNAEARKSLVYTPLVVSQDEASRHEYFIKVRSINVNNKRVSLKSPVETKLSTVVPYTTMQSGVYSIFTEAIIEAAGSMNMNRVASVAPFEFCFSLNGVENVPAIDLVLQSEMVKWRIHGKNSMVHVSDEVMCLAFLDGGQNQDASIVLGGYQLEDTLLHFDLSASMLGFGSVNQRGCSGLRSSVPIQSM